MTGGRDLWSDNMDHSVTEIKDREKLRSDDLNEYESLSAARNNLGVEFKPCRSRSPVTVQEWVAALPDKRKQEHEEEEEEEDNDEVGLGGQGWDKEIEIVYMLIMCVAGSLTNTGCVTELLLEKAEKRKR